MKKEALGRRVRVRVRSGLLFFSLSRSPARLLAFSLDHRQGITRGLSSLGVKVQRRPKPREG